MIKDSEDSDNLHAETKRQGLQDIERDESNK